MRVSLPLLAILLFQLAQSADLIVHNGKIVTVDESFQIVQAMAVRGERIVAVGENETILRLKGEGTEVIDLKGKTVLPGLIDSHVHSTGASMFEFDHPVPDMETIDDVLRYIKSRAEALPEGEWITVSQVFITRLREQRYPTREELDRAAPNHPVVFRTGPDASLNSLALKLSGIGKEARHDEQGRPGRIERDPKTGEPTGILRSASAYLNPTTRSRTATPEDRRNQLKLLFADYNSVGITSVVERSGGDAQVELFRELMDAGELTCRVFMTYRLNPQEPIEKLEARIARLSRHPLHKYNNMVWLRGLKMSLDGGMLTGSAYMREPWGVSEIYSIEDPGYRGMRYIEPAKLYQISRVAMKHGFQPTAHAQGDGAVHTLIEAYEEVNRELPVRDHRPCITHGSFMSLEAIQKMRRLGVVVDKQPAWLLLDGATLRKQFGDERTRYFHPYKTLFDHGVMAGGGSDHMQKIGSFRSINPYNPFLGMWTTLVRQPRWTDEVLHPVERITREQAIRLYTINNAYLTFEEKEKGSLEPGKLADFIVLAKDILTCPLDEVKDIQVERTYLGGRLVYRRP